MRRALPVCSPHIGILFCQFSSETSILKAFELLFPRRRKLQHTTTKCKELPHSVSVCGITAHMILQGVEYFRVDAASEDVCFCAFVGGCVRAYHRA